MNGAYEGRIPTKRLSAMASSSPITLNKQPNGTWLLDMGANAHITPEIQNLVNPKEYNGNDGVGGVGNDSGIPISHYGSNQLYTNACSFDLNNILHCPTASTNIISTHRFTLDNHCYLLIFPYFFLVKDLKTQKMFFRGRCENGLYPFPSGSGKSNIQFSAFVGVRVSVQKWHARLGHPANSTIKFLVSNKLVLILGTSTVTFCESCLLGKSTRLPFNVSKSISQFPLQLLHSDVWCSPIISNEGFRYYLLFVDDYSRYSWIFPMKNKSQVFEFFVEFKAKVEKLFYLSIKTLQCDEGDEYKSHAFQNFLALNGISQRFSCPKHPEQNGIAERKHRHIVENSIVLLSQSHMPTKFWFDACLTATYLINRMPTRVLSNMSPYERLFQRKPKYEMLKVFGCQCFSWLNPYTQNKLQPKSKSCVFLGYSLNHQGYKSIDLTTRRIYLSRHVLFNEDNFPFKRLTSPSKNVVTQGTFSSPDILFTFPLSHSPNLSPSITHPIFPVTQETFSNLTTSPSTTSQPNPIIPIDSTACQTYPIIPTDSTHVESTNPIPTVTLEPTQPLGSLTPSNEQVLA